MIGRETIEVEVKIPIDDFEMVFKRLQDEGFVPTTIHEEIDTYFNSEYYDLKEHDKALRIRRVVDKTNGESWAEFNCKGPKLDNVSVSRKEIETPIENPDDIEGILVEIGFLPVKSIVKKMRHYFERDRIHACIDQVEGLGDFLELEILECGEDKREACLKEIEEAMNGIGFGMEDTVRESYLSMLQAFEESKEIRQGKCNT